MVAGAVKDWRGGGVDMVIRGRWQAGNVLCCDCINVNTLVVILYHSFKMLPL